jgi:hypothetical protein
MRTTVRKNEGLYVTRLARIRRVQMKERVQEVNDRLARLDIG